MGAYEAVENNQWICINNDPNVDYTSSTGISKLLRVDFYQVDSWGGVSQKIYSPTGAYLYDDEIREEVEKRVQFISMILNRQNENKFEYEKAKNILLLSEIRYEQNKDEDCFVPEKALDNALRIIHHIIRQPELFITNEQSVHMQFEASDNSYLEFEVFEDRVSCMYVPRREYEKATFPDVSLDNLDSINSVISRMYNEFRVN